MIKVQTRKSKKIIKTVCFTLLFTLVVSSSAPFSITSHAQSLSLGVSNVDFASSLFTFLASFDVFSSVLEDPLADPYSDYAIRKQITDLDIQEAYPMFQDMNNFDPGLGDEVKAAVITAALGGSWVISQALVARVRAYLENEKAENAGVLTVGSKSITLPLNNAGYVSVITVNYHLKSNSSMKYTDVITFTANQKYLSYWIPATRPGFGDQYYFTPAYSGTVTYTFERGTTYSNPCTVVSNPYTYTNPDGNSFTVNSGMFYFNGTGYYELDSMSVSTQAPTSQLTFDSLGTVLWNLDQYGTATADTHITATIGDVEEDIVSEGSTIESDGTVAGNLVIPVASIDKLQAIINNIQSGILTIADAVKLLGVARVDPDATQQEKEDAISDLTSTYPYIDSTDYGSITIANSSDAISDAHAEESSIADSAADTLNGGNEPSDEDKNKAGKAAVLGSLLMWLGLWNPPGLDPLNPEIGGVEPDPDPDPAQRSVLVEILGGVGVVGGLLNDLWDSVGGSSGLGIIFTTGASFVIFSIIIGAANYFGAYQERQEIKASRSQKRHDMEVRRREKGK